MATLDDLDGRPEAVTTVSVAEEPSCMSLAEPEGMPSLLDGSVGCRLAVAGASPQRAVPAGELNSGESGAGSIGGHPERPLMVDGHGIHLRSMLEALTTCKSLSDCGVWLAW